jgi:putative tricarboxylic transport membrane protein
MAWKDRLSGVSIIIFSGVTIYLASQLPMGRAGKPGPGIFPLLLSVVIGFLSLALLLTSLRSKGESGGGETPASRWRIGYLLGEIFLYAFLLRPLGFLISTWIFLLLLKPVVKKTWAPVLLGASLLSVAFFIFFKYLLKVELPMGILSK